MLTASSRLPCFANNRAELTVARSSNDFYTLRSCDRYCLLEASPSLGGIGIALHQEQLTLYSVQLRLVEAFFRAIEQC
jgi:hypothetical protein